LIPHIQSESGGKVETKRILIATLFIIFITVYGCGWFYDLIGGGGPFEPPGKGPGGSKGGGIEPKIIANEFHVECYCNNEHCKELIVKIDGWGECIKKNFYVKLSQKNTLSTFDGLVKQIWPDKSQAIIEITTRQLKPGISDYRKVIDSESKRVVLLNEMRCTEVGMVPGYEPGD
jgi:hypothetical protein